MGEVIAANLHRLRTARRMSLATLAARADVAKATLANLEQGRGNPTIETLWSLALGLGVAFSDLLEDRRETTTAVVRAQQGARVHGSTPGGKLDLRLLDRIERGGLVEVFDLFLPAGTEHLGRPHGTGVESNSRRRSQNDGETFASWPMTRQICGASPRSRLL